MRQHAQTCLAVGTAFLASLSAAGCSCPSVNFFAVGTACLATVSAAGFRASDACKQSKRHIKTPDVSLQSLYAN